MINTLRKSFVNYKGWSTKRKFLLIESDDWGSIRMPNKQTYHKLLTMGIPVDKSRYSMFDSLESPIDLERLFETLSKVKDKNNKSVSLTANYLVANADFEKIKNDNFNLYYHEDIFQTYNKYGYYKINELIKNGIDTNIFYPQFHGKEHMHPQRWMFAVKNCSNERLCFNYNSIPGVSMHCKPTETKKFLASCDYYNESEKKYVEESVANGLLMFKNIFGFSSKSFIAPQSIRGNHLDSILFKNGVLFHQNGQQLLPSFEAPKNKIVNHFWGHKNKFGLLSWRRNVTFEPSENRKYDSVSSALKEIENAFFWGKPAVINSHRVNYIGSLSEENQLNSLSQLEALLLKVVAKWPNVEFINSQQLGEYMLTSLE
jgi:hypothetical protein